MSSFVWMSDLHLDFYADNVNRVVYEITKICEPSDVRGLLISGDITTSRNLITHLAMIERALQKPIYFVLGNHDFYDSSYEDVNKQMVELSSMSNFLKYLPTTPYVQINNNTVIVGANGWYDGIHGRPSLDVIMMDWIRMKDYQELFIGSPQNWEGSARAKPCTAKHLALILDKSRELSLNSAQQVTRGIKSAKRNSMKNVIVITHIPPFPQVCFYKGLPSLPTFVAWYSSKLMGDVLTQAAEQLQDMTFTVLCGHTHERRSVEIKKNLRVVSGQAKFGEVVVSDFVTVG